VVARPGEDLGLAEPAGADRERMIADWPVDATYSASSSVPNPMPLG
jgi:hypothetical protein